MQTKDTDPLSDPTLAKLLEVDSDLAAQEAKLLVQLQEIEEKRRSLKIVTSMFMPKTPAAPADTPQAVSLPLPAEAEEESSEPPLPGEISRETAAPKAKRTRASTRRTPGKQRGTSTPAGSRESWRPYVREELPATAALPEIASKVLHRLPERVFSVPELMNAIFVEEISRDAYKTARGRLLNLLSKGVKEGQWYRSDKGHYKSSAEVAEMAVDASEPNSEAEPEVGNQQL